MTEQRAPAYLAGIVGAFAVVGVGVGLVQNFALSFLIETLVDPGTNPTDNTLVGIVLVVDIFLPFAYGILFAGAVGFVVGRAFADRRGVAAVVGSVGSGVGFLVFDLLALFLTVSVLSRYGGGTGGGPFGPAELFPVVVQAAIPAAIVGGGVAFIMARVTTPEQTGDRLGTGDGDRHEPRRTDPDEPA